MESPQSVLTYSHRFQGCVNGFFLVVLIFFVSCSKSTMEKPIASPPKGAPSPPEPTPPLADPYDQIADEILLKMDKLLTEVAQVKTKDEAKAAVPQLERQIDELKYAADRLKSLPALAPDVTKQKKEALADHFAKTVDEYERQLRRCSINSQIRQPLQDLHTRMISVRFRLNNTLLQFPRGQNLATSSPTTDLSGGNAVASRVQSDGSDVVTIIVSGIPPGMFSRLSDIVHPLNDYRPHHAHGAGGDATFQLTQIKDFQKLQDRITFGKITRVDQGRRCIYVELNPAKLP